MKLVLTCDLEDLRSILSRDLGCSRRALMGAELDRAVDLLLEVVEAQPGAKRLTFFTTGQVARDSPHLVARLAAAGHEIGCHNHEHELLTRLTPSRFAAILRDARAILQDVSGQEVAGYRAPQFTASHPDCRGWAWETIAEAGFDYDSSKLTDAPRPPGAPPFDLIETRAGPLPSLPVFCPRLAFGRRYRVLGGSYMRAAPLGWCRRLLARAAAAHYPPVIYVHPHDIGAGLRQLSWADLDGLPAPRRAYWYLKQRQWFRLGNRGLAAKLAAILREFPNAGPVRELLAAEAVSR